MRKVTSSKKWGVPDNAIKGDSLVRGERIADAVNRFRINKEQQGWIIQRTRPRDPDEVKALNLLARRMLRNAIQEGTVRYDKERRVLSIASYSRSDHSPHQVKD